MRAFEFLTRTAFAIAALVLMGFALGLIVYAVGGVWGSVGFRDRDVGDALLEAVSYTVIAIAVFDVGKYLLEEEAIRGREMRNPGEARRSLTKFISTIVIAVLLESIVTVFEAGKESAPQMLYPTFLLFVGVLLLVGLGVYQRLSVSAERQAADPPDEDGKAGSDSEGASSLTDRSN
ncbi:GNAT family acetyltransferase [Aureimonas leprariae]|uniref:GNAT family acetyltransferase n=1 Tax=Plantimonas leprariae TaxID=2615207 RepID=A0A7V7PNQ5_9HYPH|nr:GNAT family acetyltransferase [Aureimonas leprariae]KAB0679533.1 GNAT family acetyltransferase [Aureimonas leprariae]